MLWAEKGRVVSERAPDCRRCLFFSVSGDPSMPYACAQFGIKSARLPSHDVFLATGHHCPVFNPNPRIKAEPSPPPLDTGGWLA